MANINNYINAARASLNSANQIESALADNKIRFANMAVSAIDAEAQEVAQAVRSKSQVVDAKTNAEATVQGAQIRNEADKSVDKSLNEATRNVRKAGMIAAGANSLAMANYFSNKKDQPNDMLTLMGNQMNTLQDQQAQLVKDKARIESEYAERLKALSKTNSQSQSSKDSPSVSADVSANHSARPGNRMSKPEILKLAVNSGFSPEDAQIVYGIAGGESGFDPTNSTIRSGLYKKEGEDSVGLMQINWGYHKDRGWLQNLGINKREDLFDPVKNMKAAKYLHSGSGGFGDWTVYDTGNYLNYINK